VSDVLFCDWENGANDFDQTTLYDIGDPGDYKLIFFDPLNFAINNGLRQNGTDIWIKEYPAFFEADLLRYLGRIKPVISRLHAFIDAGGILVMRANFPNTHIQLRKRSVAGSNVFTQSVISPFFWLEEFFGRHSFEYSVDHSIKFVGDTNPLAKAFHGIPVESYQTQQRITKGDVTALAHTKRYTKSSIVTCVSFLPEAGQIYLIPRFLVKDENRRLVEAFTEIVECNRSRLFRPPWLDRVEEELITDAPEFMELRSMDRELEQLQRSRSQLAQKLDDMKVYTKLLHGSERELVEAVQSVWELLGFYLLEPPAIFRRAGFDFYLSEKNARHIVGLAVTAEDGPVPAEAYDRLKQKIENCGASETPKGILIANSWSGLPPGERPEWFAEEMLEKNKTDEFCLLSTYELFEMVRHVVRRTGSHGFDILRQSLRRDLIGCVDVFALDRRKYFGENETAVSRLSAYR